MPDHNFCEETATFCFASIRFRRTRKLLDLCVLTCVGVIKWEAVQMTLCTITIFFLGIMVQF